MNIKWHLMSDFVRSFFKSDHRLAKARALVKYFLVQRSDSAVQRSLQSQFPVQSILLLTTRCNLSCPDCFYGKQLNDKGTHTDMDLEDVKAMIASPLFWTVCRVALVGGEPLLNENFLDIVRFLKNKGLLVTATTNGFLLSEEWLDQLNRVGLNWLNVTIYEHNRTELRHLFSVLPQTRFDGRRLSLVFHSDSVAKYEDAYAFAKSLGAKNLIFCHLYLEHETRNDEERDDFAGSFDALCRSIRTEKALTLYAFPPYRSNSRSPVVCSMALGMVSVSPARKIAPCCHLFPEEKFGSVDDPKKIIQFKKDMFLGVIPEACRQCYMLRASVY